MVTDIFQITKLAKNTFIVLYSIFLCVTIFMWLLIFRTFNGWVDYVLTIIIPGGLVILFIATLRFIDRLKYEITSMGITIRGFLGETEIPWNDITEVRYLAFPKYIDSPLMYDSIQLRTVNGAKKNISLIFINEPQRLLQILKEKIPKEKWSLGEGMGFSGTNT